MAKTRVLELKIAVVPFGEGFRAATKLGEKTVYSNKFGSESDAVRHLFATLGDSGPFSAETSLALDLMLLDAGQVEKLLSGGE